MPAMRRLLTLTCLVVAASGLGTGTASAVCDPEFRPLCLSPCITELPERIVESGGVPDPIIGPCPR